MAAPGHQARRRRPRGSPRRGSRRRTGESGSRARSAGTSGGSSRPWSCSCWGASSSTRRGRRSRTPTTTRRRTSRRSTRRASRPTASTSRCRFGLPALPILGVVSPAFLILWGPGLFRLTCYYYRKAYYRSFWGAPPACAVPRRPPRLHRRDALPADLPEPPPLRVVRRGARLHRDPGLGRALASASRAAAGSASASAPS